MLSMSNVANAGAAKSYYGGQKAGDYYAKDGASPDAGGPDGAAAPGLGGPGDSAMDGAGAGSVQGGSGARLASSVQGAGWQLNLNATGALAERISAYLADRGIASETRNPDDPDRRSLTVYGGERDVASDIASLIHREFGHELVPPGKAVMSDDTQFVGNVWGRFDVANNDPVFHRHGSSGVPFLKHDMSDPGFLPDRSQAIEEARERAHGILSSRYGILYTGSGREADPARADRTVERVDGTPLSLHPEGSAPAENTDRSAETPAPAGAVAPGPTNGPAAPGRPFRGSDLRASEWFGKGAEAAGLTGPVSLESFQSVLEGQVPNGPQLGRQQRGKEGIVETVHASGTDLTFSAPKSVSVLALVGGDRQIIEAHQSAVRSALAHAEQHYLETRVSKAGKNIGGQQMVAALFREEASRALEPQLHTHSVVANMVRDAKTGQWRSMDNAALYDAKMRLGLAYRVELARQLKSLGYTIERTSKDGLFEVAGVPPALSDLYSSRSKEVRAKMKSWGRTDAVAAANAATATRSSKRTVEPDHLIQAWREVARSRGFDLAAIKTEALEYGARSTDPFAPLVQPDAHEPYPAERDSTPGNFMERVTTSMRSLIDEWRAKLGSSRPMPAAAGRGETTPEDLAGGIKRDNAVDAVLFAIAHHSERNSTFTLESIRHTVLTSRLGNFRVSDVEAAIGTVTENGVLLPAKSLAAAATDTVTTATAVKEETAIGELLQAGKGSSARLGGKAEAGLPASGSALHDDQKAVLQGLLASEDRFIALDGAGEKGALVDPLHDAIAGAGGSVLALGGRHGGTATARGPARQSTAAFIRQYAGVAAGRYTREGLKSMRDKLRSTVLFVNDADRLSRRNMLDLTKIADTLKIPHVVLAGDSRRSGAIGAGQPFAQALNRGIAKFEMTKADRQTDPIQRDAVMAAHAGRAATAFRLLGENRVFEARPDLTGLDRDQAREATTTAIAGLAVDAWAATPAERRAGTTLIAPSKAMRAAITAKLRQQLKTTGQLSGQPHMVRALVRASTSSAETRLTASYQAGRVVQFRRTLTELGIKAGDALPVVGVDRERVLLQRQDGKTVHFDPDSPQTRRGDAVTLYDVQPRELAQGERVKWTSPDKANNAKTGDAGVISRIEQNIATIDLDDGSRRRVDLAAGNVRFDHNYVQSALTADPTRVGAAIVAINSGERFLANARSFYESVAVASTDLRLVVDDRDKAIKTLLTNSGDKLTALESQDGPGVVPASSVPLAVQYAIAHLTEREAVIRRDDIAEEALKAGLGDHSHEEIEAGIDLAHETGLLIKADRKAPASPAGKTAAAANVTRYTTKAALVSEHQIVKMLRAGQGNHVALATPDRLAATLAAFPTLNDGQRAAVTFALTSNDRFIGVLGWAGVGKTFSTKAITTPIQEEGHRVLGIAPTTTAVRELSNGAGIEAQTIARFLMDYGAVARGTASPLQLAALREEMKGTVLAVDETSMASNSTARDIMKIVTDLDIRAIVLGDTRQSRGVQAGKPLDLLVHAGMAVYDIEEIIRQKDSPKLLAAVTAAGKGQVAVAMGHLADSIVQIPKGSREQLGDAAAEAYLDMPSHQRDETLIVAPARFTRNYINRAVHDGLTKQGVIGAKQETVTILDDRQLSEAQKGLAKNYEKGHVVRFIAGLKAAGIDPDSYLRVSAVDQHRGLLLLEHEDGRKVEWGPGITKAQSQVTVYEERKVQLGANSKVRWLESSNRHGIQKGDVTAIDRIDADYVHVRLVDGQVKAVPKGDRIMEHLDHAYARTVLMSQGMTTTKVIAALSTQDHKLATQQLFYVAISRAKMTAKLFTDDLSKVTKLIQAQTGKALSALEHVGYSFKPENKRSDQGLDNWISAWEGGHSHGQKITVPTGPGHHGPAVGPMGPRGIGRPGAGPGNSMGGGPGPVPEIDLEL